MVKLVFALVMLATSNVFAGPPAKLNIDPGKVTVSGISAGGQMAHQMHIAYPDMFSGVGIIAGGPFGCAAGSLTTAMTRCMGTVTEELPVAEFAQEISAAATDGRVGDFKALGNDPVWVFHGALDTTVAEALSTATVALYDEFMPTGNIRYVDDVQAAHNFPSMGSGSACDKVESPFVGNCDFDAAGELLQHLYGDLEKPSGSAADKLLETTLPGAQEAGLAETAYLYVPATCQKGALACKAHLVLHGCAQSSVQIKTAFIEQSGYLPWAEANNIVLAFPQVVPSAVNPFACWDWWGYTGATYRWRDGPQMKVLADWMQTLSIH